jgi:pimeloyl-ACP methyl ester carboxylesterase
VGRVVALDFRGFGDSQWSAEAAYQTDDHVADLGAVLDAVGSEPVFLVGSSWGGLVAIAYAAAHPDRVGRVALVDVAPSANQAEDDVPAMTYDFAGHEEVVAAERAANPHAPQELLEVIASHGTRPGEGGMLVRKRDPFLMRRWPFRADNRWSELSSIAMPVLIVHAAESFIPIDVAERMERETANATLVEIPDSGHVVPVENPTALADVLAAFLS